MSANNNEPSFGIEVEVLPGAPGAAREKDFASFRLTVPGADGKGFEVFAAGPRAIVKGVFDHLCKTYHAELLNQLDAAQLLVLSDQLRTIGTQFD